MGMIIENISQISLFRQSQFDWDVAVMPTGPEKRVVRLWPDSFAISSQSKTSRRLGNTSSSSLRSVRWTGIAARKVPIYRPLAMSPDWLERDLLPNKMIFIESIAYGDPLEFRPRWGEWNNEKGNALNPAWRGQMAIETAMKNAGCHPAHSELTRELAEQSGKLPRTQPRGPDTGPLGVWAPSYLRESKPEQRLCALNSGRQRCDHAYRLLL